MSALIFLIILSFLVIIHELGHFLFARWAKIKVEEFGLGYPPKALTFFKDKLGTIYTLNWLPFGGFVRMFGEDSADGETGAGAFGTKPVTKRLLVVLAGATINFIFGVIAFGMIYSRHGIPTDLNGVKIGEIVADSPAAQAGLPTGVIIVRAGQNGSFVDTRNSQQLIQFVQENRGERIDLVTDSGETYQSYVRTVEETPQNQGALGVGLEDFELKFFPWYEMPFRGMWVGLKAAVGFGGLILQSLGTMLRDLIFAGQVPQDVAGPVGIVYAAEKEGFLREGFWAQLNFAAILSINLAIVNVLPFPALDGGRAVFLFWELLTRKRVNPKVEQWVNTAGFALLLGLIVLISLRDVGKVIADQAVQNWFKGLLQ